eukprot:TRINITY_DN783_c1_g1_i1.p1 TRINITY_DN783_c1_g1~~TRINITY_DN783_c1_g1_i1.p1  ORF type:complete len:304 (-),score=61.73 TRINITY_DN783_c1_g1_i1:38-949(-)
MPTEKAASIVDDSAWLRLESDTLIFANKTQLTLHLPRRVVEQVSVRGVYQAVQTGFVCYKAISVQDDSDGSGQLLPAFCDKCGVPPVRLTASADSKTRDTCTFCFDVSPLCTSTHTHLASPLFIAVPLLAHDHGCAPLVTQPFHILSRNCKYSKRKRANITAAVPEELFREAVPQWKTVSRSEPVFVDESTTVIAGSNTSFAVAVATLAAVPPRLAHRFVILLSFMEGCTAEFVRHMAIHEAEQPLPTLRRLPVVYHMSSKQALIITVVDPDEFPTLYTKALSLIQAPLVRDGLVRWSRSVVY